MLFNGKYYNKPGHLGMTRAELLEKLNGVKAKGVIVEATIDENMDITAVSPITGEFATSEEALAAIKAFFDETDYIGIKITDGGALSGKSWYVWRTVDNTLDYHYSSIANFVFFPMLVTVGFSVDSVGDKYVSQLSGNVLTLEVAST